MGHSQLQTWWFSIFLRGKSTGVQGKTWKIILMMRWDRFYVVVGDFFDSSLNFASLLCCGNLWLCDIRNLRWIFKCNCRFRAYLTLFLANSVSHPAWSICNPSNCWQARHREPQSTNGRPAFTWFDQSGRDPVDPFSHRRPMMNDWGWSMMVAKMFASFAGTRTHLARLNA